MGREPSEGPCRRDIESGGGQVDGAEPCVGLDHEADPSGRGEAEVFGNIAGKHGGVAFVVKGADVRGLVVPTVGGERMPLIGPMAELADLPGLPRFTGDDEEGAGGEVEPVKQVEDSGDARQRLRHNIMNTEIDRKSAGHDEEAGRQSDGVTLEEFQPLGARFSVEVLGGVAGLPGHGLPKFGRFGEERAQCIGDGLVGGEGKEGLIEAGPVVDAGAGGDHGGAAAGHGFEGNGAERLVKRREQEGVAGIHLVSELGAVEPTRHADIGHSGRLFLELFAQGAVADEDKIDFGEIAGGLNDGGEIFFGGEAAGEEKLAEGGGRGLQGSIEERVGEGSAHDFNLRGTEVFNRLDEIAVIDHDGGGAFAEDFIDENEVTKGEFKEEGIAVEFNQFLEVGMEGGEEAALVAAGEPEADHTERTRGDGNDDVGIELVEFATQAEDIGRNDLLGGIARKGEGEAGQADFAGGLEDLDGGEARFQLGDQVVIIGTGPVPFRHGIGKDGHTKVLGVTH